jgi:hypothetical protein
VESITRDFVSCGGIVQKMKITLKFRCKLSANLRAIPVFPLIIILAACGIQSGSDWEKAGHVSPLWGTSSASDSNQQLYIPDPTVNDPDWSEEATEHYWPDIGTSDATFGLYNPNRETVGVLFIAYSDLQEPLEIRYVEIPGQTQFSGRITDIFPFQFTGWAQAFSTMSTQGYQLYVHGDTPGVHPSLTNTDVSDVLVDQSVRPLYDSDLQTLYNLCNPSQIDAEIIVLGLDYQGNELYRDSLILDAGQRLSLNIRDIFDLDPGNYGEIHQVVFQSDSWIGGTAITKNVSSRGTDNFAARRLIALLPPKYSQQEITYIRNPQTCQERGFVQYQAPYGKRTLFRPIRETFLFDQANAAMAISSYPTSQMFESSGASGAVVETDQTGTVSLAWDQSPSPNISGYKVYWGSGSRRYRDPLVISKRTSYKIANLVDGNYFFSVTAFRDSEESGFSNEVPTTVENINSGCDTDGNGMVNLEDVTAVVQAIHGSECSGCDIDNDGYTGAGDLTQIINTILGTTACPR